MREPGLGRHELGDFARQQPQVDVLKMHVQGPREIQESLHYAIQAQNFFRENVDLAGQFVVRLAQPLAIPAAGQWRSGDS